MSHDDWQRAYRMAWETYYTREHVETVLRRNVAMRCSASNAILLMTWFGGSIHIEGVHPLEAGFFRYKFRRDRRPGFAIEPRWKFYPAYAAECAAKLWRWGSIYAGLRRIYVRIKRDPARHAYQDLALTMSDDDIDTLDLYHQNAAAETFVARERPHQAQIAI
jgi:hypothetical protein